ncbi:MULTISPECIES: hypothetical protein [unclassified Novosphingobium]|uniref:hypothetical protein n=1 Tax=unclassified Novosphingobium TaxID=2644732 RepID=UPI0013574D9D|nr:MULTISPECIES: hypothetical protein [unclassified Novosphingobium]
MAGVARAIVSPLSIIDKDLGRLVLQVVAVVAVFIPGGQPVAAAAALALATLYKPKGPKPEQQERSIKTALPPRISAYGTVRLYGAYMLYDTNADGFAVDAWAFHDGRIDSILFRYLGDKRITLNGAGFVLPQDKEFGDGDTVRIGTRLGLATETAFSELITRLPGIWTNNHRGDGVVTGCMISKPVKQKNFNDVYPQGGPDANQLSLVVQAQRVFDWRDVTQSASDPSTWRFSDNAALCTAHYYMTRAYKDWETHFAPTLGSWTAAANDCDVAVPLKAGGTEKRYRVALAHKHTDTHKATIGNLLAAWDGFIAPRSDGALVAWSGRYVDPDPADLIGPDEIVSYSWDYGIVDEDQSNEIAVSYLSADHDYTTVDATSWRDEDAIFADGELKTTPLENAVPSHGQARRLAKRLMAKTMAPNRGSVTTTIAGRKIRGKRFIPLHIEEAGAVFFSGTAEIVRLRRNLTTGGVTFDWIKADPNVDAWNPATEEGNPAPVGNRVAPEPLETPTITTATPELDSGGTGARVRILVEGYDRDDITWYARWRATTDVSWIEQEYTDIDPGPAALLILPGIPVNIGVDVSVAYSTGDGRISEWAPTTTVSTSTATLAPSPSTELTATGAAGSATVAWRNPTSSNFSYTRVYRGTTNVFGAATLISGDITGGLGQVQQITDTVAAGTYFYWTRAYSSAGVAATPTGPQSASVT